jgi:hypothetical protein
MTKLPDPRVEACATARLIYIRAQAISNYARTIFETPDPTAVQPEAWAGFMSDLEKLHGELGGDVETFAFKAQYAT